MKKLPQRYILGKNSYANILHPYRTGAVNYFNILLEN